VAQKALRESIYRALELARPTSRVHNFENNEECTLGNSARSKRSPASKIKRKLSRSRAREILQMVIKVTNIAIKVSNRALKSYGLRRRELSKIASVGLLYKAGRN
jgi:hypothetical protein